MTEVTQPQAIETMLLEERRYPPAASFSTQANAQPDIYDRDFEDFWETEGRNRVTWFEPFQRLYEWDPPYAKWFIGGKTNASYNCVDRWVEQGKGDKVAFTGAARRGRPSSGRTPTSTVTSSGSPTA